MISREENLYLHVENTVVDIEYNEAAWNEVLNVLEQRFISRRSSGIGKTSGKIYQRAKTRFDSCWRMYVAQ